MERLTLPSLQQSLEYSLGSNQYYGPYFALEIEVAPGLPHTTAISLGGNVVPPAVGGIEIFDDATRRATAANSILNEFDTLQWGSDATRVYAANNSTSSFDFYSLSVNPGGISLQTEYDGAVSYNGAFGVRIHFHRGSQLIYIDNGLVLDPSSGRAKGAFAASGLMVPDSTIGRTFFLTKPADGSAGLSVEVFDLITLRRLRPSRFGSNTADNLATEVGVR